MKQNKFPLGWNDKRVKETLAHYESQTGDEAAAEDEAAFEVADQTAMEAPAEPTPACRKQRLSKD